MERYPLETLSRSKTNNFFFTSKVYSIERRRVSSAARTAKIGIKIGINRYTAISKKVVGETGERRMSNGGCTTERNCAYAI